MKRIILSILFLLFISTGYAQNEQLNPKDPNFNIELNDLLQQLLSGVTQLSVNANQASQITGIIQPANGGTGQNLSSHTTGGLYYDDGTNYFHVLAGGAVGTVLTGNGSGVAPSYQSSSPKVIVTSTADTTGATTSGAGTVVHYQVIDSGTDWASKPIFLMANFETNTVASFTVGSLNIVSTGATAIKSIEFNGADNTVAVKRFNIYKATLPAANSYNQIFSSTAANNTQTGYGIGVNSSGNLCLVTIAVNTGADVTLYSKIDGLILRAP